jgi:hypothetical protein
MASIIKELIDHEVLRCERAMLGVKYIEGADRVKWVGDQEKLWTKHVEIFWNRVAAKFRYMFSDKPATFSIRGSDVGERPSSLKLVMNSKGGRFDSDNGALIAELQAGLIDGKFPWIEICIHTDNINNVSEKLESMCTTYADSRDATDADTAYYGRKIIRYIPVCAGDDADEDGFSWSGSLRCWVSTGRDGDDWSTAFRETKFAFQGVTSKILDSEGMNKFMFTVYTGDELRKPRIGRGVDFSMDEGDYGFYIESRRSDDGVRDFELTSRNRDELIVAPKGGFEASYSMPHVDDHGVDDESSW